MAQTFLRGRESILKRRMDLPLLNQGRRSPVTLPCPVCHCTPVTLAVGLENRISRVTDLGHLSKLSYPLSMFHTFFTSYAFSFLFLLIIQIRSLSYHSLTFTVDDTLENYFLMVSNSHKNPSRFVQFILLEFF